jgi:serine protease inhibitor
MRNLGSFLAKALSFIAGSPAPGGNRAPAKPAEVLAQGTTAFTLNLYHQFHCQEKENLFFSPYNIAFALTMAYAGARGETADQGEWADRFDRDKTAPAPFWVTPEQKVEVALMGREDEYFHTETAGWQVLEMPYRNRNLSMGELYRNHAGKN